MSETINQPPEFKPDIPLYMRRAYEALDAIERWRCDLSSIQEQQNKWLMARAVEAADHRTHINKRVDDTDAEIKKLSSEVQPVIQLAKTLKRFRTKIIALLISTLFAMGLAVFGAWIERKFGVKKP